MQLSIRKKKKVLAAMSGGVDSSTSVALLVRQGYQVEGVFMDLWDCGLAPAGARATCCSPRDRADAQRVADHLGVSLRVVNLHRAFKECVVDPFVDDYREGRTPNPCILCNQWIKFGPLMEMARETGADFLATGHYANRQWDPDSKIFQLVKGEDGKKDQSYFLFPLQQEQLARILWPLGRLTKDAVRGLARRWQLPVAEKDESQEICFIPDNDYRSFLETYLPPQDLKPGEIVDPQNRRLSKHAGIHGFTVGQRRGLGIPWKEPLYVLQILPRERQVVVGPKHHLYARELEADGVSWVAGKPPSPCFKANVRIRYRHHEAPATVRVMDDQRIRVIFGENQRAITPGQAAVLYQGRKVLGGGWIKNGH